MPRFHRSPHIPVFSLHLHLSSHPLGVDCVIVKSGKRICGTGAALANAPLVQDKSYFEMKIQCSGKDDRLSVSEYMHLMNSQYVHALIEICTISFQDNQQKR